MINAVIRLSTVALIAAAGCATDGHSDAPPSTDIPAAAATTSGGASESPATPAVPAPVALSDEDQIRQVIKGYQDAYNTNNWDAYVEMLCPAMRAKFTGATLDALKNTRATAGITTTEVLSVEITGDDATAQLHSINESRGSANVPMPLKRGDDGWQICMTS